MREHRGAVYAEVGVGPLVLPHRNCSASLAGWIISYFAGALDIDTGGALPPCSTK